MTKSVTIKTITITLTLLISLVLLQPFWSDSQTKPVILPPSASELIGSYAITPQSSQYMQRSGVRNVGSGELTLMQDNFFESSGGRLEIAGDGPGGVVLLTVIPEGSTGGEWEIVVTPELNQGYLSLWHDTPEGRVWSSIWVGVIDGEIVLNPLLDPDEFSAPLFRISP